MTKRPRWSERPDIVSYVCEAYAGIEPKEGSRAKRRVFLWEEGKNIMMGNVQAFGLHLAEKFQLPCGTIGAVTAPIHKMLIELGERARSENKTHPGSHGKYREPGPEKWVAKRKEGA